jgi:valyl-tRNA synthetase
VPDDGFTATGSVQAEGILVELDTASTIDVAAERRRLEKDLAAATEEVQRSRAKLDNPSFSEKAPEPVVAKTRERLAAAEAEITVLQQRLAALPAG